MCETIQTWLTKRLGVIVEVESESFLRMVQNGYLIAKLLYASELISEEQLKLVEDAVDSEAAFDHVVIWLRNAGFNLDSDTRNAIVGGKLFAAINLLYRLYLALKDKDKLYFINKQVQVERLRSYTPRFELRPIPEVPCDPSDLELNPLSRPLQDFLHIIYWYEVRHGNLKRKCEESMREYETHVSDNYQTPPPGGDVPPCEFDFRTYILDLIGSEQDFAHEDYEELRAQENAAMLVTLEGPNAKLAARQFVNKLQKKRKQRKQQVTANLKLERVLMDELWKKNSVKVKREADLAVSRKTLKQASFEKQIATRLHAVRDQKSVIINKRSMLDDEVKQKSDDLLLEDAFFKMKEADDEKHRYYSERARAVRLHNRVYEEMLYLNKKKKHDLCFQIVENIVDFAVYEVEYFKHYDQVLYHYKNIEEPIGSPDGIYQRLKTEMAAVFRAGESIFASVGDPFVLMVEEKKETKAQKQMEAQNAVNEQYFLDYYEYARPWEMSKHASSCIEKLDEMQLGANVLGHVVFRLLLAKYPKPAPITVPTLPKVDVAVCVNNINDSTVPITLSKLLAERRIVIIHLEEAINTCLLAYKLEARLEEPQFSNETNEALELTRQLKTAESKTLLDVYEETLRSQTTIPQFQAQEVQTPKVFPADEPPLSPRAELGRLAYEVLSLGEPLNDKLLARIFVDYLKDQRDINGWVLVNYPQNFEQAAVLEETLTANPVPRTLKTELDNFSEKCVNCTCLSGTITNRVEDIADLEFREVPQNSSFDDVNEKFRVSKLLTNPDVPPPEVDHGTYLTAYVRIEQPEDDFIILPCSSPSESDVATFYRNQGVLYILYYKVYDLPTIKHLAKLIIQDYSIPPKTSLQIFGDSVLYLENDFDQDAPILGKAATSVAGENKKEDEEPPKLIVKVTNETKGKEKTKKGKKEKKEKKKKKEKKETKGKKGKKRKFPKGAQVMIVRVDKETQIPEIEYLIESPPNLNVKPGEVEWVYVDVSIPEMLQLALASLWENVEHVYINDMKHAFFQLRILWEHFVPYMNSVKVYMNDFIARPDDVQEHLREFQDMYNKIDADMRNDDEVKAELHHRVYEFKEKLWGRCDERLRVAEEERKKVIGQDWVTKQACELTDTYIKLLQFEITRCADTLQLLNDYYTGMITKMVQDEPVFEKTSVTYINKDRDFETYSSYVKQLLTQGVAAKGSSSSSSPFQKPFNDNFNTFIAATDAYQKRSLDLLEKMEKCVKSKRKKGKSGGGGGGKTKSKLPKFTGPDEDVKQVGPKLIEEWRSAVSSEAQRTKCRMNVIRSSITAEVAQGILPYAGMIFGDIKSDIFERYKKEIKNVQSACDVFSRAIEEETALQPQLVLDGYNFYIRADVLMYEDPLPGPEAPPQERERPGIFTVRQLDELVDLLLETAPRGILSEREFLYLLQDVAHRTLEDGKDPTVPASWANQNMNRVSSYYFGETELVDWKDFVVYNLCLKFPSEDELLEIRMQFRDFDDDSNERVHDYQYYSVKFWFERKEQFRARKIKELLYKMYKTDDGGAVHYTALLLAFCKDKDPVIGVAKALNLALGCHVCWQTDVGEAFKVKLRERRMLEVQQLKSRDAAIKEIIDELTAFDIRESPHGLGLIDGIEYNAMTYLRERYPEQYSEDIGKPHVSFKESHPPRLLLEDLRGESESELSPAKMYFLPFEALLNVLMAAMPWHSTVQNIGEASLRQRVEIAYETCRSSEFDNLVFVHEFLNSKLFRGLLEQIYKFTAKHPNEMYA